MKPIHKKTKIELEVEYSSLLFKKDIILDEMYEAELAVNYPKWDMLYEQLQEVEAKIELYEEALNI